MLFRNRMSAFCAGLVVNIVTEILIRVCFVIMLCIANLTISVLVIAVRLRNIFFAVPAITGMRSVAVIVCSSYFEIVITGTRRSDLNHSHRRIMRIIVACNSIGLRRIKRILPLFQLFSCFIKIKLDVYRRCTITGIGIFQFCSGSVYRFTIADKLDRLGMQVSDRAVIDFYIHGDLFRLNAVFAHKERLLLQIRDADFALPDSITLEVHCHKILDFVHTGAYFEFAIFCTGAIAVHLLAVDCFVITFDLFACALKDIFDIKFGVIFLERSIFQREDYTLLACFGSEGEVLRFAQVKYARAGWNKSNNPGVVIAGNFAVDEHLPTLRNAVFGKKLPRYVQRFTNRDIERAVSTTD